jgi:hypothetical protein
MSIDIAMVHDNSTGEVMVHKADCPVARRMAEEGHPVMTMLGCQKVPDDYKWHSCLDRSLRE